MPYADQRKHEDIAQRRRERARKRRAESPLRRFGQARNRPAQREGIEDVIPHPRAKADVPPAPEIAQRNREIRPPEILRQSNTEQLRNARDQINAAGKIAVLLHGIGQHADHGHRAAPRAARRVKHGADHRQDAVGNNHLFGKPPEHQQKCARHIDLPAVLQLLFQLIVSPDRALNQLREKRNEQREPREILLRRIFAVVYVQQIAHGLERVKADAQRQQQPQRRRAEPAAHVVRIFERGQQPEVQQQRRQHDRALSAPRRRADRLFPFLFRRLEPRLPAFADSGNRQRGQPRRARRRQNERQPRKASGCVKAVAGQQQNNPADFCRAEMVDRRAGKAVGGQHE